ncbi:MAG: hypothetical protein NVSMB18_07840 [Acetobacteraceae bacterium]
MPGKQNAEEPISARPKLGSRQSADERDRQARAETQAGLGVPIDDVEKWVESWDTPQELPMPSLAGYGDGWLEPYSSPPLHFATCLTPTNG